MEVIKNLLQKYPEIAVFLTLALGFLAAKRKFGKFSLGIVNPGNPSSVAISQPVMNKLVDLVTARRPDLIILTDDVYGTFVRGFRSLMAGLPHNTIGVYSYSKYFGCTGWRLGVIALHEDNIIDGMIRKLPTKDRAELNHRYGSLTPFECRS